MRPKFIADGDFNERIIEGLLLREPSIDFLTASQGGTRGLKDPDVLAVAAGHDRVLVSHDKKTMVGHFMRFISNQASPGLLIVRQSIPIGQAIEEILLLWLTSERSHFRDQVKFVTLTRAG